MRKIVLGSTSIYRKALLEKLNLPFDCVKPEVDETPFENESPEKLVARLAQAKAKAAGTDVNNALVIGSDQVAVHQGKILGKPHTVENAIQQLTRFSGQSVTFLTGLSVVDTQSGQAQTIVEPFTVHFRELTHEAITSYVHAEMPLNCAGSFKSEGLGICLFEKLEGDDPNSLIGLPLIQLTKLLQHFGVDVLSQQSRDKPY
ncbi:septum formation inhibitor Maf [Thalassotalea euphylliae]|uniref:7-methyl-GTP pyrophosphatase n=2 Tax=Thalassotalea euphylliae TaxID=1655234 RepID=A0A3E0TYI0_9GAMM|nr:septum formation inhibitor Maf [Thalassotalea euphylliae]